jgi:hypothetical protein
MPTPLMPGRLRRGEHGKEGAGEVRRKPLSQIRLKGKTQSAGPRPTRQAVQCGATWPRPRIVVKRLSRERQTQHVHTIAAARGDDDLRGARSWIIAAEKIPACAGRGLSCATVLRRSRMTLNPRQGAGYTCGEHGGAAKRKARPKPRRRSALPGRGKAILAWRIRLAWTS